jgi:hypothetical protein
VRQDLVERYRHINIEHHNWWDYTYEDFASEMRENYGVNVKNINFSGFWSQGDGASFETEYMDVWEVLGRLGRQDKYPAWGLGEHSFQVTRYRSLYCHSNTMQGSVDMRCDCGDEARDVVYAAVADEYCAIRSRQVADVEKELLDFFRDKADELYRQLEEEYEYLTSDEAVWETIEANGLNEEDEE